jgi:uncharacterized protein (TIGR03067 family)
MADTTEEEGRFRTRQRICGWLTVIATIVGFSVFVIYLRHSVKSITVDQTSPGVVRGVGELEGKWQVVAARRSGTITNDWVGNTFEFSGRRSNVYSHSGEITAGPWEYLLDPGRRQARIDLRFSSVALHGVVRRDGDMLLLCLSHRMGDRPRSFNSVSLGAHGHTLLFLVREGSDPAKVAAYAERFVEEPVGGRGPASWWPRLPALVQVLIAAVPLTLFVFLFCGTMPFRVHFVIPALCGLGLSCVIVFWETVRDAPDLLPAPPHFTTAQLAVLGIPVFAFSCVFFSRLKPRPQMFLSVVGGLVFAYLVHCHPIGRGCFFE